MMFKYGKVLIGGNKPVVIAEAGVNHLKDLDLAKKHIQAAKRAGASVIKFQTYSAEKLTTASAPRFWSWSGEHDNKGGQRDSYSILETPEREFTKKLFGYCNEIGIEFMSTPFDLDAADMLNDLGSNGFKLASGDLLNVPLLRKLGSFGKPVFISTGAANLEEIKFGVDTLEMAGASDICIMHCTLCYPTRLGDANLSALNEIAAKFPGYVLGLSDHTIGNLVPALSTMLGCRVVEKHFTVDKSLPDSADHWLSVDEDELQSLVRNIEKAMLAYGNGHKAMLDCEIPTRLNARRSLVVNGFIQAGEMFNEKNLTCKRPGTGISSKYFDNLIGLTATKNLHDDHMITFDDILEDASFKPITESLLKVNYNV